ncbi:MAG: hypothetical protein ACK6BS_00220, partial [Pseudanabaena sp.]
VLKKICPLWFGTWRSFVFLVGSRVSEPNKLFQNPICVSDRPVYYKFVPDFLNASVLYLLLLKSGDRKY